MPDPVQNALAAQPSNNLAYIGPTPRNWFMGGIADLLAMGYKLPNMPRMGVPGLDFVAANRNRLLDMLGVGDVQKTADALSYGNAVGTGAGMTWKPLPETLGAAMAVAPFAGKAIRATEGLPVGASIKAVDDAVNVPQKGSKLVNIPIDMIEHGESVMPGGKLTWPGAQEKIKEYAERKTSLPPIDVVSNESGIPWMVADGSHRLEAAKLRGEKTISAYVSPYDKEGLQLVDELQLKNSVADQIDNINEVLKKKRKK